MKRVFVMSPLRGTEDQFALIDLHVANAIADWQAEGNPDPVMLQSCAARLRAKLQANLYAGNTALCERLCLEVSILGYAPFAPHLLYPRFLRDSDPADREAGIEAGLAWMKVCDEVWVYRRFGLSVGMRHEMVAASGMNKPIVTPLGWMP
jgi:hypothetical protein